ncbi:MAG: dienelactone hydrolase family protein [Candidatus ainarchaeum sp.]|nr:dienelactone hydrolase family protein [Candidatus ainarchaeum sp.]
MAAGRAVRIPAGQAILEGNLVIPKGAKGLVIFAHGSGSSRLSPRNMFVAGELQKRKMATLLFDLLTEQEDQRYENRFNIELLAGRLIAATEWAMRRPESGKLKVGYFGASTGSAAALIAAAKMGAGIRAVVSRGGRPDLAMQALPFVDAPVLLIVGGNDHEVIGMNETAFARLKCEKKLKIVPGATHLFEEPGALEAVAQLAADWFSRCLK